MLSSCVRQLQLIGSDHCPPIENGCHSSAIGIHPLQTDAPRARSSSARCKQMPYVHVRRPPVANSCHSGAIPPQTDAARVRHAGRALGKMQVQAPPILGCAEIIVPVRCLFAPMGRQSCPFGNCLSRSGVWSLSCGGRGAKRCRMCTTAPYLVQTVCSCVRFFWGTRVSPGRVPAFS